MIVPGTAIPQYVSSLFGVDVLVVFEMFINKVSGVVEDKSDPEP